MASCNGGRSRARADDCDDRKRKRESALVNFQRYGVIDGFGSLTLGGAGSPCAPACDEALPVVKSSYNFHKGILKKRPNLKGADRHKSQSPKKRKVVFDEKTLEELQREKEHDPPKRKVDEHNTPYHDTYHHLSSDDEEFLGTRPSRSRGGSGSSASGGEASTRSSRANRSIPPEGTPSPNKDENVHFHFNVQFNLSQRRASPRVLRMKDKQLKDEEGQLFKLLAKTRVPLPEDGDEEEEGEGGAAADDRREELWREQLLAQARLQSPPSFLSQQQVRNWSQLRKGGQMDTGDNSSSAASSPRFTGNGGGTCPAQETSSCMFGGRAPWEWSPPEGYGYLHPVASDSSSSSDMVDQPHSPGFPPRPPSPYRGRKRGPDGPAWAWEADERPHHRNPNRTSAVSIAQPSPERTFPAFVFGAPRAAGDLPASPNPTPLFGCGQRLQSHSPAQPKPNFAWWPTATPAVVSSDSATTITPEY
eukprot:TRINITY_DN93540_c0_g1_i1.p1 TRINITY_DN93540_c0_g1~~TRINITY_DN93540_c0_g1_i1.p1  ORF type:complete len:489 (-),score=83.06 TRINITY_DN93540_c0_g1_i1:126-1553(-)